MKIVRLADCVTKVASWNPARAGENEQFSYIDIGAVNQQSKKIDGAGLLRCVEAPSRARQLVKVDDVLVSSVRPNLNAVAKVLDDSNFATASTGFCVLRANKDVIDPNYLFNWVKTDLFINDMVKKATGASYPAVSDKIVFNSTIPLPSLAEQKRIAAILDKAAEIKAKREQAIAKLDELAQSTFVEMFDFYIKNESVQLRTICNRVTDGTHQSPKWVENGIPFIFISNVVNGEINLDTSKFISSSTYQELTRNCSIDVGDVLYTTVGSYGNVALVRDEKKFAFQRHIAHIKPNRNLVNSCFMATMLRCDFVRRQVDKVARGVAQKTVNLGDLAKLEVICPPIKLQQEFEKKVRLIDAMKVQEIAASAKATQLSSSLQHQAFTTGFNA